jgi:hypothetical protein
VDEDVIEALRRPRYSTSLVRAFLELLVLTIAIGVAGLEAQVRQDLGAILGWHRGTPSST